MNVFCVGPALNLGGMGGPEVIMGEKGVLVKNKYVGHRLQNILQILLTCTV